MFRCSDSPHCTLLYLRLCPSGPPPVICLSIALFNVSDGLDWSPTSAASRMIWPRWTGREGGRVLGESTAVRNLMPSTAVMPDTRCASHFVRSLAELRASVCRYLFPSSQALATWPDLETMHACAFAQSVCIKVSSTTLRDRVDRDSLKINSCLLKDNRKGRVRDRKEGGFRNESGREFGVPVTWLECRAPNSNGCVIRSVADTEDFLPAAILQLYYTHSPHLTLGLCKNTFFHRYPRVWQISSKINFC